LRIKSLFGSAADTIFTPPWNRCTQDTVNHLNALGFDVLSRDLSGTPVQHGELREIAVGVDWSRYWKKDNSGPSDIARRIADLAGSEEAVGIMLHHAEMDTTQRMHIQDLLRLLRSHPNAACRLMRDVGEPATSRSVRHRGLA
jgi:hypothetical protein